MKIFFSTLILGIFLSVLIFPDKTIALTNYQPATRTVAINPLGKEFFKIKPTFRFDGYKDCQTNSGSEAFSEWFIAQGYIDEVYSICNRSVDISSECPGATYARGNEAQKICWWKNENKYRFYLNSAKLKDRGCDITNITTAAGEPGGYQQKVEWSGAGHVGNLFGSTYNFQTAPYTHLGDLDKLLLSVDYEITQWQEGTCPNGVEVNTQVPITVAAYNPKTNDTIIVYAVLYDNRTHFTDNATPPHIDCQLPFDKGSFIVIGEQARTLGLTPVFPGKGKKTYEVDYLPLFKTALNECYTKKGKVAPSLNELTVLAAGWNNESIGNFQLDYTIQNPQIKFVMKKESLVKSFIEKASRTEIIGWAVDLENSTQEKDVSLYKVNADNTTTLLGTVKTNIFRSDVNQTIGTGISGNHGFKFTVPAGTLQNNDKVQVQINVSNTNLALTPATKSIIIKTSDFNKDGKIDTKDLSIFLSKFNSTDQSLLPVFDLDENGKIAGSDLSLLLSSLQK